MNLKNMSKISIQREVVIFRTLIITLNVEHINYLSILIHLEFHYILAQTLEFLETFLLFHLHPR